MSTAQTYSSVNGPGLVRPRATMNYNNNNNKNSTKNTQKTSVTNGSSTRLTNGRAQTTASNGNVVGASKLEEQFKAACDAINSLPKNGI